MLAAGSAHKPEARGWSNWRTLERVGEYPVRGFSEPIELFAYHG
jgi:hypothetical protein